MKRPHLLSFPKVVLLVVIALLMVTMTPQAGAPRFYRDDPLLVEVETQDASGVRPNDSSRSLDVRQFLRGTSSRVPLAMNVNSVGEVPDSSWFTNRIGYRHLSVPEIAQGPATLLAPPAGPWTVIAGKTDGVTPGLQLKDRAGRRFFVKFDPLRNPEMASGAEIVATKLLFALGYNVPENYIATLRRSDLILAPEASFKGPDGMKRAMTQADVDRVLQQAAQGPDGTYRMLASLGIEGKPLGPFQYAGTRPDDPNDIVPHEHRRELRALRAFAAWLNHVDTKAQNSFDTLVNTGTRSVVRHYLLDFGSALGSAGTGPKDWRDGHEYGLDKRTSLLSLLSFGTYVPEWLRIRYPDLPAVGRIESRHFQPARWKPTLPNPAFQNARPDDLFWAAQHVMAFSDEAIEAVVATAHFSDPAATRYLSKVLIERRDQIGRAWLTDLNPIASPSLDRDGRLRFRNAAVDAHVASPPAAYQVRWFAFDNSSHVMAPLGPWESIDNLQCGIPFDAPPTEDFIVAAITAVDVQHPDWATPVLVYLRRDSERPWKLVGVERMLPER